MKVAIGNFYLSNGNNFPTEVGPENLKLNGTRVTQTAEFLRAPQVKSFARLNHKKIISFEVTRQFENADDASKFILLHELSIPDSGICTFTTEGNSNIKIYMGNTVVQSVSGHQEGLRTFHSYTILGGETSITKPSS